MDLLETNRSTAPKPVLLFRAIARNTLAVGSCTCDRCKRSGGDQAGYKALHTAEVNGRSYRRLFVEATARDVYIALGGAWEARYQVQLPKVGTVDLETIRGFGNDELADRLVALVVVMGIIREEAPGRWTFAAGPYK